MIAEAGDPRLDPLTFTIECVNSGPDLSRDVLIIVLTYTTRLLTLRNVIVSQGTVTTNPAGAFPIADFSLLQIENAFVAIISMDVGDLAVGTFTATIQFDAPSDLPDPILAILASVSSSSDDLFPSDDAASALLYPAPAVKMGLWDMVHPPSWPSIFPPSGFMG